MIPDVLLLDEPVNGLDPEGILWIRNLLKALAAEGRTVFVSSHLMSEMAVTATEVIVVGRGRLIAAGSVDEVIRGAGGGAVLVRTAEAERLATLLAGARRATIRRLAPDTLQVTRHGQCRDRPGRRARSDPADRADAAAGDPGRGVHGDHPRRSRVPRQTDRCGTAPSRVGRTRDDAHDLAPDRPRVRPRVTQAGVIRSEWIKLRSLRSTWFSLLAAVVIIVGLGTLFSAVCTRIGVQPGQSAPARRSVSTPTQVSLRGVFLAQLAIGVLGVLVITGEYSTGMIRSSLAAVPHRQPVLIAKAVVFAVVVFVVSLASTFAAFLLGQRAQASTHAAGVAEHARRDARDRRRRAVPDADRAAGGRARVPGPQHRRRDRHAVRDRSRRAAARIACPTPYSTDVSKYLPLNAGSQILVTMNFDPTQLGPWAGIGITALVRARRAGRRGA